MPGHASRIPAIAVHVLVPFVLSATALAAALLKLYDFTWNAYDYELFSNLLWNFAHGNGWLVSLYEGQPRMFFLADHLVLLIPLLAPFFSLFPSPYTFSVLHNLAFAATFFLVPVFVREVWKQNGRDDYLPAALFLLLALLLFRGFGAAWRASSMPTLVMPFLLASFTALHRKSLVWACLFSLIMALAEERAAVAVFGVGMYAWGITKNRRLGLTLCAFSALWFFTAVKVVIPYFAGGEYFYGGNIHPFHALPEKAKFLFRFFSWWFFLPLFGKRAVWAACCALPLLGLALVSNRPNMYGFWHQYQDLPSIFFLAASTFGLLRLTETAWFRRLPRCLVALLACVSLFFSYTNSKRCVPAHILATWRPQPEVVRLNADLAACAQPAPGIKVYTPAGIGFRFALRKHKHELTTEAAARNFTSSMVFIAPKQNVWSFKKKEADEIVPLLLSNPSLRLTERTPELLVFTSTDLLDGSAPTAR
jgi:uncharacterized membrane protein